jgi:3-isopropylmalate/(R)-2-methylmalate dehydratase large subunit
MQVCSASLRTAELDMGLAPGGRMRQETYTDEFRPDEWDTSQASRCFVHLANSLVWRAITGENPPTTPPTAVEYTRSGLPWFHYYGEGTAVECARELERIRSVPRPRPRAGRSTASGERIGEAGPRDHASSAPEPERGAGGCLLSDVPRRVLLLTKDPALIRRQLDGDDIAWTPELELRDEISTDEITPAAVCYHADAALGEYPYTGLTCTGSRPVRPGDVRRGGFTVSASGRRRGKGSSREASPYAERAAGIRFIIAESFERIYRENCQHLGLLTSTDFGLLDPLRRGDTVPLERFMEGEGPVGREVIRHGGLLPFGQARLRGEVSVPAPLTAARPMTLGEKLLAVHWVTDPAGPIGLPAVRPGDEGFVQADLRFSHEYVTPMAAALWAEYAGAEARVRYPESVLLFRDHLVLLERAIGGRPGSAPVLDLAGGLARRQEAFAAEQGIRVHADADGGSEGICHSLVLERYARPGQVIVGSDSHTPHAGAIGCLAFGVGTTAICHAWLTGDARVRVPPSLLVRVRGTLGDGVAAKDLMLALLAEPGIRRGIAVGRLVEYAGPGVQALSIDERATLTNMAAELGAFSALVQPDTVVARFLEERRGMDRGAAERLVERLWPDPGAEYEAVLDLDAGAIAPMVALPGDPGNGIPLDRLGPIPIDIAYAGSCTAGKRDDMDMYARVFREAAAAGRRVAPGVRCYVQFGSRDVERYAAGRGYLDLFRAVGVEPLPPGCGACINAGPGVSYARETVTVSAINRNFPGRSGPGQVYLASPYTVAASALAGRIAAYRPLRTVV